MSVSVSEANIYSLLLVLPMVAVLAGVYGAAWRYELHAAIVNTSFLAFSLLMASLIIGVAAHEFIHGLAWAWSGGKPLGAIRFGFQFRSLTPYAHCREPLEIRAYRMGLAMPGVLLGLFPSLAGIASGNGWSMIFGVFFTLIAGGDLLVLWLTRKVRAGALVEDHPTRPGCYVIGEPSSRKTER